MQDITLEEIQKKFESLPENLRLAIIVAGADKKINTIGREHGLNVKQISELLLKTHIMMFGFIHPDKFEDSVKEITNIPAIVVRGIVRDVNEQILKDIRDDLIELAEKPHEAEAIESTVEGQTISTPINIPKETIEVPVVEIKKDTENEQAVLENKQNDEILKSAGIEISPISFGNEIKKEEIIPAKEIKTEVEIPHESIYAQTIPVVEKLQTTTEDEKNTDILKSAGIEISSFDDTNKIKDIAELAPVEKPKEEVENEEVMKIAFENLEEKEADKTTVPAIVEIQKPIQDAVTSETSKEIEKLTQTKEIPAPAIPLELEDGKEFIKTSTPPTPAIKTEIKPKIEEAIKPKESLASVIKTEEAIKPKEEIIAPVVKTEEKPKEEEHKAEEPTPSEITQAPTEEKPEKNLKQIVKNINAYYQAKGKSANTATHSPLYSIKSIPKVEEEAVAIKPNYENPEKLKENIILAIVEVQDKIKTIKDRTNEIEKEKTKLEKAKKETPKTEKGSVSITEINEQLSDLFEEEKIIQKLRENDLPKEYLELLEKLDKLNTHNNTKKDIKTTVKK